MRLVVLVIGRDNFSVYNLVACDQNHLQLLVRESTIAKITASGRESLDAAAGTAEGEGTAEEERHATTSGIDNGAEVLNFK